MHKIKNVLYSGKNIYFVECKKSIQDVSSVHLNKIRFSICFQDPEKGKNFGAKREGEGRIIFVVVNHVCCISIKIKSINIIIFFSKFSSQIFILFMRICFGLFYSKHEFLAVLISNHVFFIFSEHKIFKQQRQRKRRVYHQQKLPN